MRYSRAGAIDERLKLFPDRPIIRVDEVASRVPHRGRAVLLLLLEAYRYARESKRRVWDFAVEIEELRKTGCTNSEVRWLVCKGIVDSAREIRTTVGKERAFENHGGLVFDERSCFALTDCGATFARSLVGHRSAHDQKVIFRPSVDEIIAPCPTIPKWDRDRQELRLGTLIVKRYKVPATNQERILAAFEEEQWPVRIDDPLPPHPDRVSKRRLHDTINALNRNQKHALLRFRGDGKGKGVRWDLVQAIGNGRSPNGNGSDRCAVDASGERLVQERVSPVSIPEGSETGPRDYVPTPWPGTVRTSRPATRRRVQA